MNKLLKTSLCLISLALLASCASKGSKAHEHNYGADGDAIKCDSCGEFIYNLVECEYNGNTYSELPTYADPTVELRQGKNLIEVDLVSDGEDEWKYWTGCGFFVAFYATKEASHDGDWNQLINVVTNIGLYDLEGNKLNKISNDNSGHYNFFGSSETEVFVNENIYLLVEASASSSACIYFGDC